MIWKLILSKNVNDKKCAPKLLDNFCSGLRYQFWCDSNKILIIKTIQNQNIFWVKIFFFGILSGLFDAIEQGKEASIKYYTDSISEVKNVVPKEKLLVFSVKEGWEPLCKFLDLPMPIESFPQTNDTKMMKRTIKIIRIASYCLVFGLVPVILGISKYILKY